MKILTRASGALVLLLLAAACSTIDMSTYEDANIYAELEMNDPKQVILTVDNRSGAEFVLDPTRAAYLGDNRELPLISLNETGDAPVNIEPGTQRSRNFTARQALSLKGRKPVINDWVPADSSGMVFRFNYHMGGEEGSLAFPDPQSRTLLGKVTVTADIVLPFFKSIKNRRLKLYRQAQAQAAANFSTPGKKPRLVNLHYSSTNNGFVEKAVLSADVVESVNP
ncbi:MAG: hypothetical protein LBK05_08095 [Treponema sp.]|jgi:hypothetical protein|nr:hypothetical protein [Treponema sp.]